MARADSTRAHLGGGRVCGAGQPCLLGRCLLPASQALPSRAPQITRLGGLLPPPGPFPRLHSPVFFPPTRISKLREVDKCKGFGFLSCVCRFASWQRPWPPTPQSPPLRSGHSITNLRQAAGGGWWLGLAPFPIGMDFGFCGKENCPQLPSNVLNGGKSSPLARDRACV